MILDRLVELEFAQSSRNVWISVSLKVLGLSVGISSRGPKELERNGAASSVSFPASCTDAFGSSSGNNAAKAEFKVFVKYSCFAVSELSPSEPSSFSRYHAVILRRFTNAVSNAECTYRGAVVFLLEMLCA